MRSHRLRTRAVRPRIERCDRPVAAASPVQAGPQTPRLPARPPPFERTRRMAGDVGECVRVLDHDGVVDLQVEGPSKDVAAAIARDTRPTCTKYILTPARSSALRTCARPFAVRSPNGEGSLILQRTGPDPARKGASRRTRLVKIPAPAPLTKQAQRTRVSPGPQVLLRGLAYEVGALGVPPGRSTE